MSKTKGTTTPITIFYSLTIIGKLIKCWICIAALYQSISRSQILNIECFSLPGMVLSQTTLAPAVMNTTLIENVTSLTPTPVILSSTTPSCSAFNTSTCEPCAPGSQYDNSESVTLSPHMKPPVYSFFECDRGSQKHLNVLRS